MLRVSVMYWETSLDVGSSNLDIGNSSIGVEEENAA